IQPPQETAELLMTGNLKRPLNLSEVWFNLYSKGQLAKKKGDYAGACEHFGRLISYQEFPLIELAKLYQLESCSYTGHAFPSDELENLEIGFPSGFLPEFREVAYAL